MVNIEKVTQLHDFLAENPAKLHMGYWGRVSRVQDSDCQEITCGTTACIAGWAVILDGWKPNHVSENGLFESVTKDGTLRDVENLAGEILGITRTQQNKLFFLGDDQAVPALQDLIEDPETTFNEFYG